MCPNADEYVLALIMIMCWEIWKCRCTFVFQKTIIDPIIVGNRAVKLINEFWNVNGWHFGSSEDDSLNISIRAVDVWCSPQLMAL